MARRFALVLFALALGLTGCGGVAPEAPSEPVSAQTTPIEPPEVPETLEIGKLGLRAELEPLGVDIDNRHEVPATAEGVGWFVDGPEPGEVGAAIILGHINLHQKAGAFARLGEMRPGDSILLDGRTYLVYKTEQVDKNAFPVDRVYNAQQPELRLISCGGAFDGEHYTDNVIVYAEEV